MIIVIVRRFYEPILMVLGILLLTSCGRAEPTPMPTATPLSISGRIVALGDSLTEGFGVDLSEAYPAQLEHRLQEAGYGYEVINAGVSGETSSGARSRLSWVLTLEPDVVILMTGGNDGLRGIDPAVTAENIDAMVTELMAQGIRVVLIGMEMIQNMGDVYTSAFRAVYPTVAKSHGIIFVPSQFEAFIEAGPGLLQADGIHPTAEGYGILVVESGEWRVESGEWRVENEEWRMKSEW